MTNSRMYHNVVTWNPFKGCRWNCTYCVPSFQRLAKMAKCEECKTYTPHEHPERLDSVPKGGDMLFVCSSGDICFCDHDYTWKIINAIRDDPRDVLFQTKSPGFWNLFTPGLPANVILGTTLETNRDAGYEAFSEAPPPTKRWRDFFKIGWPRMAVTIEPVMDFDLDKFAHMILVADPLWVWLGYNTRPGQVELPEPPHWKVRSLIRLLEQAGVEVRLKEMRGLEI